MTELSVLTYLRKRPALLVPLGVAAAFFVVLLLPSPSKRPGYEGQLRSAVFHPLHDCRTKVESDSGRTMVVACVKATGFARSYIDSLAAERLEQTWHDVADFVKPETALRVKVYLSVIADPMMGTGRDVKERSEDAWVFGVRVEASRVTQWVAAHRARSRAEQFAVREQLRRDLPSF
jgi:hypothetical protein